MKRTLSTIGLWTIVFGTVYFFGVNGGVVLLAVLTLLAQYEFHGLLEKSGLMVWRGFTLVFGCIMILAASKTLNRLPMPLVGTLAAAALVYGALAIAKDPANLNRLAGSVLSLAYVPGLMMFYALLVRDFADSCDRGHGVGLAIWVIAVAKFTDVGGYLVGSAIGRHKLAPSISPGKTWEGVAGGLAMAALVASLGVHFAAHWLPYNLTVTNAALLALPMGFAAIASDLSESAFKRRAGVKDSGNCIPGIGGALDLADSLLLTAPVAYYLLLMLDGS